MSRLELLLPETGWARIAPLIPDLPVEPLLFGRDGVLRRGGEPIAPSDARYDAAWFGLDLFAEGNDEAFLAAVQLGRRLRWLQSGRTGHDHPAFASLAARGVRISISNGPAPAIAEYVLAGVLDHFQRGPERRRAQAETRWEKLPFREVAGSRWLCLGFGEIGRQVARRARALGAHVTGVRRSGGSDPDADAMTTPGEMAGPLADVDVVVVALPLTGASRRICDKGFFAGMRGEALFVNVGRGPLVDETALREALDAGRIAHALLDVTEIEPLPQDSWQWAHPRVTLTGHTSGIGSGLWERTDHLFVDNLRRYLGGEPLLLEVDPAVLA